MSDKEAITSPAAALRLVPEGHVLVATVEPKATPKHGFTAGPGFAPGGELAKLLALLIDGASSGRPPEGLIHDGRNLLERLISHCEDRAGIKRAGPPKGRPRGSARASGLTLLIGSLLGAAALAVWWLAAAGVSEHAGVQAGLPSMLAWLDAEKLLWTPWLIAAATAFGAILAARKDGPSGPPPSLGDRLARLHEKHGLGGDLRAMAAKAPLSRLLATKVEAEDFTPVNAGGLVDYIKVFAQALIDHPYQLGLTARQI